MELLSLKNTHPARQRMSSIKIVSVVLHVTLLAGLLYSHHLALSRLHAGRPKSQRITAIFKAGRSAAPVQPPKARTQPPKAPTKPADPKPTSAAVADSKGDEDVTIAMAVFFPTPKPDLSVLPRGTKGDVVIDVVIDEDGKVAEAKVDQSLGAALDDAVLATVETWTFEPAMKAGKPVASEQQLLFHYERT